jgi:hypothetical protein
LRLLEIFILNYSRLAEGPHGDSDLKLFVLFARSDDAATRCAAAGALASVSYIDEIAKV